MPGFVVTLIEGRTRICVLHRSGTGGTLTALFTGAAFDRQHEPPVPRPINQEDLL